MTRLRVLSGLLGLLVCAASAPAQPIFLPGSYGVSGRSSIGYMQGGRRGHITVYVQRSLSSPYPYGWPASQVYVFYASPPSSIVVLPRPGGPLRGEPEDEDLPPAPRRRPQRDEPLPPREVIPPPPEIPAPLPGDPASVFRPIRPADRQRAQQPIAPAPAPEPAERGPFFPPDEPALRRPPPPEADPKAEAARQVALARAAMTGGEYARAAERFRQATRVDPKEPLAYFLLAQADFALGKYPEAVSAIEAGMHLNPDWPKAPFRPFELYGPEVMEFSQHLLRLERALERHPQDPVLAFLFAYELWFDGRQEEALPLFQRVLNLAPEKTFIRQFLLARPAGPVVTRSHPHG